MFNFHELMRHFDMAFTACCLVPVVLLTNICRVHEGKWLRHVWMEFALDFVLGFVLFRFAVFIGVISDITSLLQYNWLEVQHPAGLLSISCLSYNKGSNWLTFTSVGLYVRTKDCQPSSYCSVRFKQVEPKEFVSRNRLNRQ